MGNCYAISGWVICVQHNMKNMYKYITGNGWIRTTDQGLGLN